MQRKQKRSSILKPPKQTVRAPLQDLDSIQGDEDDGTTQPSSRRVSFSRTSQIKEFDPTIGYMTHWNQSYEESINIVENDENHPKSSNALDEIIKIHTLKLINKKRRSSKFQLSLNSAGIEDVENVCLNSEQPINRNIIEKIVEQSRASINSLKANDAAKSDMSMFCDDLDVSISRRDKSICSNMTADFFDSTIEGRISEDTDEAHNLEWKRDMLSSEPKFASSSDVIRKSNDKKESNLHDDNTITRNQHSCSSIQNQTVLNSVVDMDMTLGVNAIQDTERYRAESPTMPILNTSMDMTVPFGKIAFHESNIEKNKSINNQERIVNESDIVGKDQILEQPKIKVSEKKIGNPIHGTSLFLYRTIDNDVDMDITMAGGTIQIEGISEAIDACQEDHLKELASESLDFTIPLGNMKLEDAESSDVKSDIQENLNDLDTGNPSVNIKSNKEKNVALSIAETDQDGPSQTLGSLSEMNETKHKSFCDGRGDKTFLNAEGMEFTVPLGMLNVPNVDKSCKEVKPSESFDIVARQQDIAFATDTDSKENIAPKLSIHEQILKRKGTKRHAESEMEYISVKSAVNCSISEKNGCDNKKVSQEADLSPGIEVAAPLGKFKMPKLEELRQTIIPGSIDIMSQKDSAFTTGFNSMANLPPALEWGKQHSISKISENSDMECTVAGGAIQVDDSYYDNDGTGLPNKILQQEDETLQGIVGMELTVPIGKLFHQNFQNSTEKAASLNLDKSLQDSSVALKAELKENVIVSASKSDGQHLMNKDNITSVNAVVEYIVGSRAVLDNQSFCVSEDVGQVIQIAGEEENIISEPEEMEFTLPFAKLIHPKLEKNFQDDESVNSKIANQKDITSIKEVDSIENIHPVLEDNEKHLISNHNKSIFDSVSNSKFQSLTDPVLPDVLKSENLMNNLQKMTSESSNKTSIQQNVSISLPADLVKSVPVSTLDPNGSHSLNNDPGAEHVNTGESTQVNHSQCNVSESVSQSSHIFQQDEETLPNDGGMELKASLGKLVHQKLESPFHKAITEISGSISTKTDGTVTLVADSAGKSFPTSNYNEDNKGFLDEMDYTKAVDAVRINCISYYNSENSSEHCSEHYDTIPDTEGMDFTVPHGKLKIQKLDDSHQIVSLELLHANQKDITVTRGGDSVEHSPAFDQNEPNLIVNKNIADRDTECAVVCGVTHFKYSNCEGVARQASQYEQQEDEVLQDNKGMEFTLHLEKSMQLELKSPLHKLLPESLDSEVGREIDIICNPGANSKEDIPILLVHNNETLGNPEIGTTVVGGTAQVNHTNILSKCPEEDETFPDNVAMEFTVPLGLQYLEVLQEEISESSDMVVMPKVNTVTKDTDLAGKVPSISEHLMSESNEKLDNHEKNCNASVQEMKLNQSLRDVKLEKQKFLKEIPESFKMLEGLLANNKEDELMRNIHHNEQPFILKNREIPIHTDVECAMVGVDLKGRPNDANESINQVKTNSQKGKETFRVTEVIESSKFQTSNEQVSLNRSNSEKLESSVPEVALGVLKKTLSHEDGSITKNVDIQENSPLPVLNSHFIVPNGEKLLNADKKLEEPDTVDVEPMEIIRIYSYSSKSIIQSDKDSKHKDKGFLVIEGNVPTDMKDMSLKDFPVDPSYRSENKYIFKDDQNSSITLNKMNNKRENPYGCTMPDCKRAASEEQLSAIADHRNEDENTPNLAVHSNGVEKHENEKEHDTSDLEENETSCDTSNGLQLDAAVSHRILERFSSSCNEDDSVTSLSKSLSEKSSSSFSPGDAIKPFIAEDWIKEEADKKSCPWLIHKLTDEEWSFLLFYQSVKLTLVLEPLEENFMPKNNNRVVGSVQLTSCLIEGNRECDYVVHHILLERCPSSSLVQICPSTTQIPELFQFLNSEVENINVLLGQVTRLDTYYPVVFKDEGFIFSVNSMKLLKVFHVKVSLMNWENGCIKPEDVTIINYIGKTRESDIQAVVGLIKNDKNFLLSLYDAILDFMEQMEKLED